VRKARRWSFNPDGSQDRSNWQKYAAKYPERQAFYKSAAWTWARHQQLSREPNCRICGEPATAVDHVILIAEGGAELDEDNLQSLCRRHHNTKTTNEGHRGMKRAAQRWKNPP
jgi:5-methylcytosine-specific restriction protein A